MTDVSTEIHTTDTRWADSFASFFDRWRKPLFVFVLVMYLIGFNGQWRMEPDSALYLSIGRNLAEGRGYTYHGRVDRLAYPGMPWVHAMFFKMFPSGTLVPVHVFMLGCAIATLALTYRLLLLHGPRADAVIVTYGIACCYTFCRYGYELRNDMPFLMGVMAFLVGYESLLARYVERVPPAGPARTRWFDWIFLVDGFAIAVLMRPAMWALVATILLAVATTIFRRPINAKRIALVLGVLLVVIVTATAFFQLDPRRVQSAHRLDDYEGEFLVRVERNLPGVLKESLQNFGLLTEKMAPEALFSFEFGPVLNSLVTSTMFILGLLLFRRRIMWGLWVAATLLMIIVVLPGDRYLLAILPLLIYGWWRGLVWLNHRIPTAKWANIIFLILLGTGYLPNSIRAVGKVVIEQRRTPFLRHYKEGRYEALPAFAQAIDENVEVHANLIATRKFSRILNFLTRRDTFDPRDLGIIDTHEDPIYAIGPIESDAREMIDRLKLRLGDTVTTINRRRGPPWTVQHAWPIYPARPTTAPR